MKGKTVVYKAKCDKYLVDACCEDAKKEFKDCVYELKVLVDTTNIEDRYFLVTSNMVRFFSKLEDVLFGYSVAVIRICG